VVPLEPLGHLECLIVVTGEVRVVQRVAFGPRVATEDDRHRRLGDRVAAAVGDGDFVGRHLDDRVDQRRTGAVGVVRDTAQHHRPTHADGHDDDEGKEEDTD
jgi:hypothetical protein